MPFKPQIDEKGTDPDGTDALPSKSPRSRVSNMSRADLENELPGERAKSVHGEQGVFIKDEDFQAILRNVGHKQAESGRMKKLVFLLLGLILLIGAVTMSTSFAAVELAKDSHVKSGTIVDSNGNAVATASADLSVCADGSLAKAGKCNVDAAGRRLQEGAAEDGTLSTVPLKQKFALSSSLSDKFFMSLDEVVVFSDKGHTLRLEVHGFARIPVLNSRCGNVVHLYTAWNGRLTLDSGDLSFDAETEAAFSNAGFSLAVGGVSGRRLAMEHSVEGFFSAVQGVEDQGWTCQDVPLPTLPELYTQTLQIYRPCAVAGVTGTAMDPCDSMFGGVMPGTAGLSRENQLATMSKTDRIRASMSVDVPLEKTLFLSYQIETMKSASYEVQITSMPNHPGQKKVNVFDRRAAQDAYFQVITGHPQEGRFFCNTSGTDSTPQKTALAGEQAGVDRTIHFELMDMVEEGGKILRHFRMMPSESFLNWMSAKNAADRPTEAYYEYWDLASDLSPVRLLNPDGSLVVFNTAQGATTDADVEAKLAQLGSAGWSSLTSCTDEEKLASDVLAPSLGMPVPLMNSPMSDLNVENFAFYAKLHLNPQVEPETGNGWETLVNAAGGSGPLSAFASYALRARDPISVPDVCYDSCPKQVDALRAQLQADPTLEFCNAPALNALVTCMTDEASTKNSLCMKSNFFKTVHNDCMGADEPASTRRLEDDDSFEVDATREGGEDYIHRIKKLKQRKSGGTKQSHLTTLKDGTRVIDLDALDAAQRTEIAEALGVSKLAGGKVYFNATDSEPNQKLEATLHASEEDSTVHSRRLMMDMKCMGPGVGPGCLFKIGYPWSCDVMDGDPPCKFGIAVKVQIGGPANGALTVAGSGCVEEWAFGVPKPFSGSVCIDGGISVSWSGACGLPFSLSGWLGLTAAVGLDLVLFSFTLASIRIEAGAAIVNYKYNCDDRRRRRRWLGGRRRGSDEECETRCDVKVYAKATFTVLIGRVWGLIEYYVSARDFDFKIGADIYIWAVFTSWWETVAQVQIV